MKQGEQGHLYASKAEEWAIWAMSCLEHNPPASKDDQARLAWFGNTMMAEYATQARHSHAQRQIAPEIGVTTTQAHNSVLWPFLAFSVVCILGGAWASGWL